MRLRALFADLLTDFADPDSSEAWTVPSSERFAAAAGALGIGDGATVVIYDQHDGFWGTRLWWHLRLEGFDAVAVLDGGLRAWRDASSYEAMRVMDDKERQVGLGPSVQCRTAPRRDMTLSDRKPHCAARHAKALRRNIDFDPHTPTG